jgi:type II secretion system protein G
MSKQSKKILTLGGVIIAIFLIFIIIPVASGTSYLKSVKFKIVDEATGEPLKNRELNICRYVVFKLDTSLPSPYLNKKADWYLCSVKTDSQGRFTLDLSSIEADEIVVEPDKPYSLVRFSRSNDLSHTKSDSHIRITRFEPGTTQVVNNMIYDLKRKIVKVLPISGKPEEKSYKEIILAAKNSEGQISREIEDNMVTAASAIDTYRLDIGQYPQTLDDLLLMPKGFENVWEGPYLKEIQMRDLWGNKYLFERDVTSPGNYKIISYGADGKPGGTGENADIQKLFTIK